MEKEVELATARLQAEQVSYRTAKMRLKEARIAAGVIRPDEAVMRFIAEVRDKAECFKSDTVSSILNALCDALEGKGGDSLLDLDEKYFAGEKK